MKLTESLFTVILAGTCLGILTMCHVDSGKRRDAYIAEIEQWRIDRLERLKGPRSWLSLVGRHPIRQGVNSVGTCDTNDIRLPGGMSMDLGIVVLRNDTLSMYPQDTVQLFLDDGTVFPGGMIDADDPPYIHYDALYWTFLERGGNYFFRVWDTLSAAREEVKGIPAYPPDPAWIIEVTFTPAVPGTSIILDDIQGAKREVGIEGTVSGAWQDTTFSLLALDGGEKELFLIIEDETTDIDTYPGGRYIYISRADPNGLTSIDFNKAYIPPCAFTEFATCLLPPSSNRLPFAVRAGEMNHQHHD
jgi:uncharacterized protein (DUF1684 family)